MTIKELREKQVKELQKSLDEARRELAGLKTSRSLGSLNDGSELKRKRVEIAQIMTVLNEKEIMDVESVKEEVKEK